MKWAVDLLYQDTDIRSHIVLFMKNHLVLTKSTSLYLKFKYCCFRSAQEMPTTVSHKGTCSQEVNTAVKPTRSTWSCLPTGPPKTLAVKDSNRDRTTSTGWAVPTTWLTPILMDIHLTVGSTRAVSTCQTPTSRRSTSTTEITKILTLRTNKTRWFWFYT